MINKKLAIIGVGNMGNAIALRLLEEKLIEPQNLYLCDSIFVKSKIKNQKSKVQIKDQKYEYLDLFKNITLTDNFKVIIDKVDIVILAVKPQVFPTLFKEFQMSNVKLQMSNKLIISIAAGIPISNIKNYLGVKQPVIRVMPNLAAMVGESMSVWVKSIEVTKDQEDIAREVLQSIGKEIYLENEDLIDAVTAISGSGPAYVFYLTELLESNARDLGIPPDAASILARQTVVGSAKFLANLEKSPKELRLNVTSKGGTTEAAFKTFDEINLKAVFRNGIKAAWSRAKELRVES